MENFVISRFSKSASFEPGKFWKNGLVDKT